MLSSVGDVLSDFGQEIQRIEHLETARGAGGQFLVARFRETAHRVVLGLVDHLPGFGHLDHPGLAEGTAQEILDQALHSLLVTGMD